MTAQRIQFGGCSFIPPEGYAVQEEVSLPGPTVSNCSHCINKTKPSVSITLIGTTVYPDVPDYSESPADMNPDAYPPTLTLSTIPESPNVPPLDYLRSTGEVLKGYLEGFKTDYCITDVVADLPAASSQEYFSTNFRIFRLNIGWVINGTLLISTMTTTESGVDKGWIDMRRFVESVKL